MKPENKSATAGRSASSLMKVLLPFACCLILANIYYAQPIIGDIAVSLGISTTKAGSIVTVAQIGYCIGVLFFVPLGDAVDNRRLILCLTLLASVALCAAGSSVGTAMFFCSMFFVGFFSSVVQVIVPLGVGLTAPRERGRVLGLIMAGAILGIVLARPVSSWMTGVFGWRVVYCTASVLVFALGLVLYRSLPHTTPSAGRIGYPAVLRSMATLMTATGGLRSRLAVQALVFSAFTLFWAAVPLALQQLGFSHGQVAQFALAGLAAPFCAALAGRMVDRGLGFGVSVVGMGLLMTAFLASSVFGVLALPMIVAVLMLDPGVHMSNVVIQQSILNLVPDARGRLNALCVACTFTGGAVGSALGPWLYSHFGWNAVACAGIILTSAALVMNLGPIRHAGKAHSWEV